MEWVSDHWSPNDIGRRRHARAVRRFVADWVRVLGCVAGLLGFPVDTTVEAAVVRHETLALEGLPAPGGADGETFGSLSRVRARVNASGDVVFVAPVMGARSGGGAVEGLFVHTRRGLTRLAQEDGPVPDIDGLRFGLLSRVAINDGGSVLVLSERGEGDFLLSNASGAWRVVARSDRFVEGSVQFTRFSDLHAEHSWQPLLRSSREPDVLFAGLARPVPGQLGFPGTWLAGADGWNPESLFAHGLSAPSLFRTELLRTLHYRSWGSSPGHRNLFLGELVPSGTEVNATNLMVIWTQTGRGALRVLARTGRWAHVPERHVFYREFHGVSVNAAGDFGFIASLVAPDNGYSSALFYGTPGYTRAVVRDGDTIVDRDGRPLGPVLLEGNPVLNATGQILFLGFNGNRRVLGRWSPDLRLEAMLVEGDSLEGAPEGWKLGSIAQANFNASGRVAVVANLDSPNAPGQAWGLVVSGADSRPVLVAMRVMEPGELPAPAGIPSFVEGLEWFSEEGFAGGGDGLPRFFDDGQRVVYSGRTGAGLSGVFATSVDAGLAPPRDETFRWAPRDLGTWSGLEATDPPSWTLTEPARLFPNGGLFARVDKDWNGARLRLEVVENRDPANDLLGLDAMGLGRQRLDLDDATGLLTHAGQPLGRLSRPAPAVLEMALDPRATTDGLRALVRVLAYGSKRSLRQTLLGEARHVEGRRNIRLTLTDSDGRVAETTQTVDIPKTIGLAFEGLAPNQEEWASGYTAFTTVTVRPQLRLNDGTRVTIGCAPIASRMEWFPNSAARDVLRASANGVSCSEITMTFVEVFGFPSVARLHDWEAQHVLRRQRAIRDVFTQEVSHCAYAFFSAWLATQPWTGGASARSLASTTPGTDSRPPETLATDIVSVPYALREWLRGREAGRRWIELYERHTGEVVKLLSTDFGLFNDLLSLFRQFTPGLRAYMAGQGGDVLIRKDMVAQVNRVWDRLMANGSSELAAVLRRERERFHDFRDFEGRTFTEWGELLEIGAPEVPFVIASSPELDAMGFRLEANRVNGLEYSLWRRSAVAGSLWEHVADAGIRALESTIEMLDPRPGLAARLYQVRTDAP